MGRRTSGVKQGLGQTTVRCCANLLAELPYGICHVTCKGIAEMAEAGLEERVARLDGLVEGLDDQFAGLSG